MELSPSTKSRELGRDRGWLAVEATSASPLGQSFHQKPHHRLGQMWLSFSVGQIVSLTREFPFARATPIPLDAFFVTGAAGEKAIFYDTLL